MLSRTETLEDMASPQAKLGPRGIAVLSFHPFLHTRPRPPKDGHHTKPFPMRPWGSISHNASFSASVAFRCFLSGVDSQLSGALRSKRWRSRPTVKLSNLVTKIGKNSLFPSLIIYLFAFSQGVTVPGAGLASNKTERFGEVLCSMGQLCFLMC